MVGDPALMLLAQFMSMMQQLVLNGQQPTKLTAPEGSTNDFFGQSVAVTNSQIVVGLFGDDYNGNNNSGSVYVYDATNLSAQPTKLTAPDGSANDYFGFAVAADDNYIVVGSNNSNKVYVYDATNLSTTPTMLTSTDGEFGGAISVSNNKIVVGAWDDSSEGLSSAGSAYVYDATNLSAAPTKLVAYDAVAQDQFGKSVSISGDTIIVGAWRTDDIASASGSAYVFDANDLSAQPTKLIASDGAANDFAGIHVSAMSPSSALNGTTVSQSDNVFTVTPGQQDADFQLTFKATEILLAT